MVKENRRLSTGSVFDDIVQRHGSRHAYGRISHHFTSIRQSQEDRIVNSDADHHAADAFNISLEAAKQIQHSDGVALSPNDFKLFGDAIECGIRKSTCRCVYLSGILTANWSQLMSSPTVSRRAMQREGSIFPSPKRARIPRLSSGYRNSWACPT